MFGVVHKPTAAAAAAPAMGLDGYYYLEQKASAIAKTGVQRSFMLHCVANCTARHMGGAPCQPFFYPINKSEQFRLNYAKVGDAAAQPRDYAIAHEERGTLRDLEQ